MKISSTNDLRRILTQTINDLRNDMIDVKVAATMGNLCNTMLKILRACNIEQRIEQLEELQGSKPSSSPVTSDIKNTIRELRN